MEVLEEVRPFCEETALVFSLIQSKEWPLSDNGLNATLRRMGYAKDEVTAHDFRVTASSV